MSHKCNDVFVEFGLYFAKVRLVMAKIAALEDKQKLTAEFVWKHVKAEVLAASRVSDNRFAQLVNNALQGDKFDKSHKTEVFLRTLYDDCREDQVEAVKNKIKRDRQLRLATANGGPRNEALVQVWASVRRCGSVLHGYELESVAKAMNVALLIRISSHRPRHANLIKRRGVMQTVEEWTPSL